MLPEPPDDAEKASYAWRSLPFLTGALTFSSVCAIAAQAWFEFRNPVAYPFMIYTALFLAYQAVSLPVNFPAAASTWPGTQAGLARGIRRPGRP